MKHSIPRPEKKNISDKIVTVLLIGFMAPALLTSPLGLYCIVRGGIRYYFTKRDLYRETKRLRSKGYIALTKTEQGWLIKLLPKGRVYQKKVALENLRLPKPKKWDGKWRLFIFDIPEEFKNARNMIRRKLKSLGCYNIQRSTFVYPHDCKKELKSVADYYKVSKYTLFAEVGYIDLQKELRKFFHL